MSKKAGFTTVLVENKKRILLIGLAIMIGLIGWEAGRYLNLWGEPNELLVIKAEKVAKPDLMGLELVSSEQRGEGSLVGKTVSPSVQRIFKPENGDVDATIQKIIKLAEEDGWVYDEETSLNERWVARKKKYIFNLTFSVSPRASNSEQIETWVH